MRAEDALHAEVVVVDVGPDGRVLHHDLERPAGRDDVLHAEPLDLEPDGVRLLVADADAEHVLRLGVDHGRGGERLVVGQLEAGERAVAGHVEHRLDAVARVQLHEDILREGLRRAHEQAAGTEREGRAHAPHDEISS